MTLSKQVQSSLEALILYVGSITDRKRRNKLAEALYVFVENMHQTHKSFCNEVDLLFKRR